MVPEPEDEEEEVEQEEDDEDYFERCIEAAQFGREPLTAPAPPPSLTVSNFDPDLAAFLAAAAENFSAVGPLSDWLRERDDPRADAVRDLLGATCVIPEQPSYHQSPRPAACGREWAVFRTTAGMSAAAHPGTLMWRVLRAFGPATGRAAVRQDLQNERTLTAAFERLRLKFLRGLFGTGTRQVAAVRRLRAKVTPGRVLEDLKAWPLLAPSWMAELKRSDPERFAVVIGELWKRPDLHRLGYQIMDAVSPGWQQSVLTGKSPTQ